MKISVILTIILAGALLSTAAHGQAAPPPSHTPLIDNSGLIKKGDMTGNLDKLLNINLFVSGRFTRVNNGSYHRTPPMMQEDNIDEISIPGARLYLTGQAYRDIFYKVAYEFSNENDLDRNDRNGRLTDAMLTWRLPVRARNLNALDLNIGLGPIFISPAGEEDTFFLDTIEHPLIVQNILPPGTARDKGIYLRGSFFDREILQVWAGIYNGAHREIMNNGAIVAPAVDAWGNNPAPAVWGVGAPGGEEADQFAQMARIQVKVLDEENYFCLVSAGYSRNSVMRVDPVTFLPPRRLSDTMTDIALEVRFNRQRTWLKSEFIRTRTHHADDMYGYHITFGHRLGFISDQLEVVARLDHQTLEDHMSSLQDLDYKTVGVNYFFDPENVHDAKLQLNYVMRDEGHTGGGNVPMTGEPHLSNDMLLFQFVIGF